MELNGSKARMRVAIIGGGLAGAALANGLQQVAHLEMHVYEAASDFSERGAALGLAELHQLALAQLLPSVDDTLSKAGAVPMTSTRVLIGSGPQEGKIIFDAPGDGEVVVHRAALLRELIATLPASHLHANKKLSAIESIAASDAVTLTFEDGAVEIFDAVIGADGIFGFVRNHVLGDEAPAYAASPAGFWDCRSVVPMEKAKERLGEELFEKDRQYGWCGDGAWVMHDVLDNGTKVQCILSAVEKDPPKDRKRLLLKEELGKIYSGWGAIASGMIDLCLNQPQELYGYSQMEHRATPTYASGRVCVMGDAAHATTPWQGAGAGLAFEDAVMLKTLLAQVSRPQDVGAAFKVFDEIRRPRCQRVIDSSRDVGNIFCGRDAEVGLDADKMRDTLLPRWGFIMALDLEEHKRDGVERLKETQYQS
ncbi:hypothetical protein HIM_11254 [Hirsutella minnesotensis 3608]|uniref:FAD-binding domain-containing protein n=1 Tax=Hirsutella minnesotensis 3608 TaxID=1043627 RepID=A0A0F7ZRC1_9HYPO|nr:hypothetical protein HIM_11254 [Hirsutella minnesotensis 3608]